MMCQILDRFLVERHLNDVAGNDPKMKKKVKDCLKSLERYGRICFERWWLLRYFY